MKKKDPMDEEDPSSGTTWAVGETKVPPGDSALVPFGATITPVAQPTAPLHHLRQLKLNTHHHPSATFSTPPSALAPPPPPPPTPPTLGPISIVPFTLPSRDLKVPLTINTLTPSVGGGATKPTLKIVPVRDKTTEPLVVKVPTTTLSIIQVSILSPIQQQQLKQQYNINNNNNNINKGLLKLGTTTSAVSNILIKPKPTTLLALASETVNVSAVATNNKHNINEGTSSSSMEKAEMASDNDQELNDEEGDGGVLPTPVIKLPENLEGLIRADHFPSQRHRWNTNEEIAAILISFTRHPEWLSKEVKIRPKSGSMLLYSRKKVRYRRDGYCWKKRKDGKTTREDHMKLKVQGTECIYGCYVHSAILPTFHRRCYWLLQNPDIVLVHYLNVPYPDDNKLIITSNVSMWGEKKEWTKDELISQLKPMFFSEEEPDLNNELEISTAETVEAIVLQLMEKQRLARQNVVLGGTSSNESTSPAGSSGQNSNPSPSNSQQQQQQQQQQMTISMTNGVNSVLSSMGAHGGGGRMDPHAPTHPQALPPCRLSASGATGGPRGPSGPHGPMAIEPTHGPYHHQPPPPHPHHSSGLGAPHAHRHPHPPHGPRMAHGHGPSVHGVGGPSSSERPFLVNLTQFPTTGGLIILNGKSQQQQGAAGPQMHHGPQHHHHMGPQQQGPQSMKSPMIDIRSSNPSTDTSSNSQQVFMHAQQFPRPPHPSMHPHHPAHMPTTPSSHAPPSVAVTSAPNTSTTSSSAPQQHANQSGGQQQQQGFFGQETLEMSHEDIQRTLSANMTIPDHGPVDLVPMSPNADDVFVNLDAFDILADLSEDLDPNHHHDKNTIVDINPEWAYSEGGTKILIVGQFNNPNWDYSVHFGDLAAPAVYLQTGVLKCFCPPHSPGLVPIRVYSNGKQISVNSMVFEYKADQRSSPIPVPPSETSMKLCLIHRMECLEKCFRNFKTEVGGSRTLEESMVKICCEMMKQDWDGIVPSAFLTTPCDRGITLLHAAGALGYSKLILTLIQWKREKPSSVLDAEINSLRPDDFGSVPLMWAVRNGHFESSRILASWSPESVGFRDGQSGLTSVERAAGGGYAKLATELDKIGKTAAAAASNTTSTTTAGGGGLSNHLKSRGLARTEQVNNMGISDRVKIGGMRSHRSSSVLSDDFGLKDCFFGQPDTGLVELSMPSEEESRVLTLAEQIIAAMPDRIKKESNEEMSPPESHDSSSVLSSTNHSDDNELSFDFPDRNYRYYDSGTPCSSLSPSSSCLQSPCSSSFTVDSPQPTTAELSEFLQASVFERDFSNLTLSEREQRELYEAAKVIQTAYRSYKGRKKLEEEDKEKAAACIIQNYFRRYKQYAYLRQVNHAALVIQNQFRNYCEHKRFKKSGDPETNDGFLIPRTDSLNNNNNINNNNNNNNCNVNLNHSTSPTMMLRNVSAENAKPQCQSPMEYTVLPLQKLL